MSSFDTLAESTTASVDDKFLVRQGSVDGAIKLSLLLDVMFPVGSILKLSITDNPSTLGYAGTWVALTEDMAIETAQTLAGDIEGDNIVTTPLLEHNHTVMTTLDGAHSHTYDYAYADYNDDIRNFNPEGTNGYEIRFDFGGSVSSTEPDHTHSATLNTTGTPGSTMDIRAKRISLMVWERTA